MGNCENQKIVLSHENMWKTFTVKLCENDPLAPKHPPLPPIAKICPLC